MKIPRTLIREYNTLLKNLTKKQWGIEVSGHRTVKDIIAHMVGWEKEAVMYFRSKAYDSASYSMSFKNYNGKFNNRAVKRYAILFTDELLKEWAKWQKLLAVELKKVDKEKLQGKLQLFDWIVDGNEKNHYSWHLRQLKERLQPTIG